MKELEQWYHVLGLELGASWEEVNQAYRDLAFIWHPDRIPKDNPRLQEKAEEKLKEINHARDQLRSRKSELKTFNKGRSERSPTSAATRDHPQTPRYSYSYYKSQSQTHQAKTHNHQSQSNYQHNSHTNCQTSYQTNYQTNYQKRSPYYQDFSGSDFRGANFKEKDLSGKNFSNCNLQNADLSDAFLHRVNLSGSNLENANLFRANLLEACLTKACLRNCNLIGADLSGADLSGADLTGAKVGTKSRILVKLTGTKLSGAIMPDGTIHP